MIHNTSTISEIKTLKLELEKLTPINKDDEKRINKKFRLEFNYNSNHLEGNTLTYGQTQLLLYFDKSSGNVPVSDIEEMKAHDIALNQINEMAKDKERPLNESFINELNEIILVEPFWKDAVTFDGTPTQKKIEIGKYKSTPNSVRMKNGKIHEYASPEETPALMSDLLAWYHENLDKMHPVHLAAEFHFKFVCIHPFDDGNGRVSRLIMNYILLKKKHPPVIIKSEDKENYLTALQKADTGDIISFIEYIEEQSVWSLKLSIKAAKGEDIDELEDIEKEIEILKRDKLTKTKILKTPKVSYELIIHINNDIWEPLNKVLTKFNDFFAETKVEKFVNNIKVEKTRTIPKPGFKEARIFGYDLDEEDISELTWTKKMLSLKPAKRKIDFEINCTLGLKESLYKLTISEGNKNTSTQYRENTILFEIENEYKTFFMNNTVESIIRIVSNYIIKSIKTEE